MHRPRRIRVRETQHYVKFQLADESGADEMESRAEVMRRRVEMNPPLLAWVARARMRRALAAP